MSKKLNSSTTPVLSAEIDYREISMMQQAIFDGANYGIISTEIDGTIRSFNNAASMMLGYSEEELIGKCSPALFHDPEEVLERAQSLSEELGYTVEPGFDVFVEKAKMGLTEELEWVYIRKDGGRLDVLLSVTPLKDDSGRINGFLGIASDISEKRQIKRQLKEGLERYQLLFENSVDSIFLMQGELFVDCNPATLSMFGCTREQIVQQTPYRYSPKHQPDGRVSEEKALEKIMGAIGGKTQFFEWRHLRYDGSPFDAEVTLNAIQINQIPHIFATVRDISERKIAEQELHISRKQLMAQNESLKLINDLSNQLHGSLSFQSIADRTLEVLLGVAETSYVAIFFINQDNSSLKLMASKGFDNTTLQVGQTIMIKDGITGYAIKNNKIVFVEDFSTDKRVDPKIRDALLSGNIQSGIAVPLIYQGCRFGCINLGYKTKHEFSSIKEETLHVIGNTVSQSLANAHQIQDLDFMAHHDSLTGLPNRLFFHCAFKEKSEHTEYTSAALLLLDLDRFKEVNDTLGHHIGDLLLQKIGPRINSVFGDENISLSRLGGDEFTILIDNVSDKKKILTIAEKLLTGLREPFEVDSMKLEIDASVGIAKYPEDGIDSHALLRSADVAMYEAKSNGGGIKYYDREQDKHTPERLLLITELNNAIREHQLELHYQPKIDLKTGQVCGFEALVRWRHSDMGLLYPDKFIPLAEMSDSIHYLTDAVLAMALQQQQIWTESGHSMPVAVNLSVRNLIDDRCVKTIAKLLKQYDTQPGMLELEITETALMQDPKMATCLLQKISALDVTLSIDDFGTGYSSLSYLRRMPIDLLKIDREFVKDMLENAQDAIIVGSTISLAHNLGLQVVAEGVEDKETYQRLKQMGCDLIQGYYICRPEPWKDIEQWLIKRTN